MLLEVTAVQNNFKLGLLFLKMKYLEKKLGILEKYPQFSVLVGISFFPCALPEPCVSPFHIMAFHFIPKTPGRPRYIFFRTSLTHASCFK